MKRSRTVLQHVPVLAAAFRPEAVGVLLREHRERRANKSQRLRAILVPQLWLEARSSGDARAFHSDSTPHACF
ncbi:MAG: hypothetical protein ACREXX_09355 [Gammaproteobacteria bacterium]